MFSYLIERLQRKKTMDPNNSINHHTQSFTPAVASLGGLCYGLHSKNLPIHILREWHSCSLQNYYELSTNYVILDSQVNPLNSLVSTNTNHKFKNLIIALYVHNLNNRIKVTGKWQILQTIKLSSPPYVWDYCIASQILKSYIRHHPPHQ